MFSSLQKEGEDKFECILNFPVGKVEYARKSTTQPYDKNREFVNGVKNRSRGFIKGKKTNDFREKKNIEFPSLWKMLNILATN